MGRLITPLLRPLLQPLVAGVLSGRQSASAPLPKIDYLLWLGSSTPVETSRTNTVLGRQEQKLRAAMCAAGIDVPVISRAVGGQTLSTCLTDLPAALTYMGNAVANGKKVGVLVNIGNNDIGQTDYDAMAPATRDTMLTSLNSIIDQITAAGMIPIIATSHSRNGYTALYEEWADKLYRPLIASRCPQWFKGGLAVFDYCRLYTDNAAVPNWWQGDNVHPQAATAPYQAYSANALKGNAKCKTAPDKERYIFTWTASTEYFGGFNMRTGAASGTFASGTVVDTKGVPNAAASLSWSNASGASGGARGNSGVWEVGLANHRIQSASLYANNLTISITAGFGAGKASASGTLRVTGNSNQSGRQIRITVGAQNAILPVSTGIPIAELPFTLDASGNLTITVAPQSPSTFANVSGLEFEFN